MFKGRKPSPREVYDGLRGQLFSLDPATIGLAPTAELPRVWGAMLDTGYASGVATIVSLADGTTSLYTSTGGGVIGGGAHAAVVQATRAFLASVQRSLDLFEPHDDAALPEPGRAVIRALTFQGPLAIEAAEDDLGQGHHPASSVFHAAHAVITQLRLIDAAQPPG
jgi:hypothetical protein